MDHSSRGSSRPRRVAPATRGTPATDRIGTSIAGWTVERLLGVGPVCESWLAVGRADEADREGHAPTGLTRVTRAAPVTPGTVVRVLREPFASDPQARAEWLGASWAPNRFSHARVPRVIEDGTDDAGAPLVVRRLAHGQPLDVVFRSGRPSGRSPWSIAPEGRVTAALRIAEQLLDALEMAHAHRVVHGALTPANVIVTERQTVRLVDFAIAPGIPVVLGGALRRAHASRYTAPEGEPSEAADVWSVGACLYFALTGSPPPGTLPALAGVTPDVGRGLAAVLEHALAVDPDDRYGSAYAMLGDVRRVLAGRPPRLGSAATPVSSQRASPLPASGSFEPGPTTDPTSDRSGRRQLTEAFSGPAEVPAPGRGEWRGNALLFLAIALVAAVATFVLMRERLADPADVTGPAPTQAPSR